jgi:hypothetical protein
LAFGSVFDQFVAVGSVRKYLTARAALEFPSPCLWHHHREVFGEDSVSLKDFFAREKQPSVGLIWAFLSSLVHFRVSQQPEGAPRILELLPANLTNETDYALRCGSRIAHDLEVVSNPRITVKNDLGFKLHSENCTT